MQTIPVVARLSAFLVAFLLLASPALAAVEVQRVVSPGGLEAWLVEDHSNPLITVKILFPGGAALDPEGKEGLANLASALIDEGAGDLDSVTFRQELEDRSIRLYFDAGRDSFYGTLRTLSAERDRAFALFRLALTEPRFDPEPVERIRAQILARLRRDAEDPNYIAGKTWMEQAYPDHPYGRLPDGTPKSLAAITVEDLRAFTRERLVRDDMVIGVAGDITPDELARLLDETFGSLPAERSGNTSTEPPEQAPRLSGGLTLVRRAIPQSVAVFGHAGLKRDDPDWYAAYTLNHILGGNGLVSRLAEEVREKRGLAYGVYSYLLPMDYSALWRGGVATQNARMAESLDIIRKEWRRLAEEGPTQQELDDARTYLTGSFVLNLTDSEGIADILVAMQYHDLGIDYIDKRSSYYNALTLDDLKRVARRLLAPEKLSVVIVGQPEDVTADQVLGEKE